MTIYTELESYNYCVSNYCTLPYAAFGRMGADGLQMQVVINDTTTTGAELKGVIAKTVAKGVQQLNDIRPGTPYALQIQAVIDHQNKYGAQAHSHIVDRPNAAGTELEGVITTGSAKHGLQMQAVVESSQKHGVQLLGILSHPALKGLQSQGRVYTQPTKGLEMRSYNLYHLIAPTYLRDPYCVYPYCANAVYVILPIQQTATIEHSNNYGLQFKGVINPATHYGVEQEGIIYAYRNRGLQLNAVMNKSTARGLQETGAIETSSNYGLQFKGVVLKSQAYGVQLMGFVAQKIGLQLTSVLYNTYNFRILYKFPSRGTSGLNWSASSTMEGDYSVINLNTDLVEQCWKSDNETQCWVTCDTELPQGVFLDTLGIMNHNISRSAVVTLLGADNPSFSPAGVEIALTVTDENIYYVAPTLPLRGFRYWRIDISDPNNTDGFIKIGTVVFGNSVIFQNENIVDEVRTGKYHFADKIETEGFTNVMNDRTTKRWTALSLRDIDTSGGNYNNLQDVFNYARTNLKCLWIPTPRTPTRYTVFAKMNEIPEETHNSKAEDLTYASMDLTLDEAN